MRHTKIVATIGPATADETSIDALLAAGVDVFRLNFSHGTHESHGAVISRIRAAADRQQRCVAVLQDLAGTKIRTGALKDGIPIHLRAGEPLAIIVSDLPGETHRVSTTYAGLPKALKPGDTLLLDDGRIQLRVESVDGDTVNTVVVDGGVLGEHKGINAPGVDFPVPALTDKDVADLRFGARAGVDLIALSFVRTADDVRSARNALRDAGAPSIPIVVKLERPEAIAHLDQILEEADAVMIARGDLGLEIPLEHVPQVQKDVTRRARQLGIPVIVATQVLESMRTESRPTRAEVSDAANAVHEGADAIMLAGETAIGAYPVRAVETLDRIARDAEQGVVHERVTIEGTHVLTGHGRAICEAAVTLANGGDAAAIVAVTRRGKTARLLSALRPRAPIYAASDQPDVARRLALLWGVVPIVARLEGDVSAAAASIGETLVARGVLQPSSVIVLVSITPDLRSGPSNFLKVQRV